ncbi:MAG: caspase family protein [Cyanobacteria bacterium J06649_11]
MPNTIYAVFVGINTYNTSPLSGCINDVIDANSFFEELVRSNEELSYSPIFYLAPNSDDLKALHQSSIDTGNILEPSRKGILDSFDHYLPATEGDICIFYFSGHGSTQDAPPEFWHMKSARQLETIVCLDSREQEGHDINDKELGFSIWKTMKDKTNVSFLAIMDSCHSGNNTRSLDGYIQDKEVISNTNVSPLTEYAGFQTGGNEFYQYAKPDQINVAFGSHIQLAAAKEDQTAKEMNIGGQRRGVFSYALFKTLRNGGTDYSYDELIDQISITIRNKVDRQIPQVEAFGDMRTDQQFLRKNIKPPGKEYPVYFDNDANCWKMKAGLMQSVQAPIGNNATTVQIINQSGQQLAEGKVTAVDITESVLQLNAKLDGESDQLFRAKILTVVIPSLFVGLSSEVPDDKRELLIRESENFRYFEISESDRVTHLVRYVDNSYQLTKKQNKAPLFIIDDSHNRLLFCLDKVGKWMSTLELGHPNTSIKRDDIKIEVQVIEGQQVGQNVDIDNLSANEILENPNSIDLRYIEAKQPALRVKVKTTTNSYFVSALYLRSDYGIRTYMPTTPYLLPDGEGESLRFQHKGKEYTTIPISLDKKYWDFGINRITDYLKVFVSTKHFNLSTLEQEGIPLDSQLLRKMGRQRGDGFDDESFDDWTCITIPINIERPFAAGANSAKLTERDIQLGSITINGHKGFSATVTAASRDHVKQMLDVTTRSSDQVSRLNTTLLPPASLWGSAAGTSTLTSRNLGNEDTQISILELEDVSGEISSEAPLTIITNDQSEDEVIIPYGYDEETALYIPIGFSNDEGEVIVQQLPRETSGKIFQDGHINKKTLGRSIKLFFKKIFVKPFVSDLELNRLMLCDFSQTNGVTKSELPTDDLNDPDVKNVALLIHGIIGNTDGIVDCFEQNGLYKHFDRVLTFDYENLDTPIQETALSLKRKLIEVGLFKIDEPRLTIIAHSMGGLVTRSFAEQANSSVILKKLIQVGTPNSGSEIDEFRKSLFGLITHALNGPSDLKLYLKPLGYLLKGVFNTLKQMNPGSDFLRGLNSGKIDVDKYHLIAGNTSLLEVKHGENDGFIKVWYKSIRQKGHYYALNFLVFKDANNDMAVRVDRMKEVYERNLNTDLEGVVFLVPSDHISYFNNPETIACITQLVL